VCGKFILTCRYQHLGFGVLLKIETVCASRCAKHTLLSLEAAQSIHLQLGRELIVTGSSHSEKRLKAGSVSTSRCSLSAWHDVQSAMGIQAAAITAATIPERREEISSPGGYLRALSDKDDRDEFTPVPVGQSLLRRQLDKAEV
jgi:hypothetical protein